MSNDVIYGIENIPQGVKKMIIFGCTEYGNHLFEVAVKLFPSCEVIFWDNNKEIFDDKIVKRPSSIKEDTYIVIASIRYCEEMVKQLLQLNIDMNNIVYPSAVLQDKYEKIYKKRVPANKLDFLSVDMAEHCNLNCQYCDHFSPLAKEKFPDFKEYESDLKRMGVLFRAGKLLTEISLEGGEPLLNENINEFIRITRKYFLYSRICIYTNGLLLPKKDDNFWECLRENEISLEVTKYPVSFDYSIAEHLAEKHKVKLRYFSGNDIIKTSYHKPLDLKGKNNKYDSYHKCYMGNGMCTMLKHGKIFPCTVAANLENFSNYYCMDLELTRRDSLNIYEVDSYEEILDFLANPIPACRYCQPDKWTGGHEWKTTSYKIEEWT